MREPHPSITTLTMCWQRRNPSITAITEPSSNNYMSAHLQDVHFLDRIEPHDGDASGWTDPSHIRQQASIAQHFSLPSLLSRTGVESEENQDTVECSKRRTPHISLIGSFSGEIGNGSRVLPLANFMGF